MENGVRAVGIPPLPLRCKVDAENSIIKYCFATCSGSRLELFSYNGHDHKFTLTPLNSAVVQGLNTVLWSAQGLHFICLINNNLYVHNHDFQTIVHTMPFPVLGNVVDIGASFSPGKKYLVLLCETTELAYNRFRREVITIKIIDMKSGLVKGCFSKPGTDLHIRWEESTNDQYFILGVDQKGTMMSLDGTNNFAESGAPLYFDDFAWSPTALTLILFVCPYGTENGDGSVKLLEIPSRNIVFEMPICGVTIVKFYWQSKGEYVATLYTGNDYSDCSQFNWIVYSVKTNTTSCGSFGEKRIFFDFNWEPNGSRFAYSYMTDDMSCAVVEFYRMELVEGNSPRWSNFTSVKSFSSFTSEKILYYTDGYYENTLSWSPAGRYIVLKYNKELRFVDVDVHSHNILAIVNLASSSVAWDPSGRFVQTLCDCGGELKTIIWSFRGEKVYEFSAGVTLNWGGRFPVAEDYEEMETNLMEDDSSAICKRIPEICL